MRKLLPVLLILILFMIGFFLLAKGLGVLPLGAEEEGQSRQIKEAPEGGQIPSVILSLDGPKTAHVGQILPVTLEVWGSQPVGELTVEVAISTLYLKVRDYDTVITGTQVMPLLLPDTAQLYANNVGDDGVLHYRISGLGTSIIPSRTLCLIPITPIVVGLGEVSIQKVIATAPDGAQLVAQPSQTALEIEISENTGSVPSAWLPISLLSTSYCHAGRPCFPIVEGQEEPLRDVFPTLHCLALSP